MNILPDVKTVRDLALQIENLVREKLMGLFDKFQGLSAARRELGTLGIDPFGVEIEKILSPTEGIIHGRRTVLAGTNNYLGLTFDPDCVAAAQAALDAEGTGTTGSRMANGSYANHRKLEAELAAFYGMRDAIVFSTGYQANLGMLSALAGARDVVLLDADCHASIYDGCRLAGAEVIRFRHNNAEDLAKRLRRLGARAADTLIVVEGIYSMLGDRAPLREIVAVKREHGGYLLVDEAHSLGVLGERGRGLVEEVGRAGGRGLHRRHVQQEPGRRRRFLRERSPRARPRPLLEPAVHLHRVAVTRHDRVDAAGARQAFGGTRPPSAPARELRTPACGIDGAWVTRSARLPAR